MRLNAGNVFPYAGSMNSLLAHPDGDDAVALLLQGHAAVVISVGTPLSTHGSALGVIARREGIATARPSAMSSSSTRMSRSRNYAREPMRRTDGSG